MNLRSAGYDDKSDVRKMLDVRGQEKSEANDLIFEKSRNNGHPRITKGIVMNITKQKIILTS